METAQHKESTGTSDWHEYVGRTIRTDGLLLSLCTDGKAAVSVNMQKVSFRKGDLLVLTSDVYFSVSEVSECFSTRYASLSEENIETAYYMITSAYVWDYLHYHPILRLSQSQRKLVIGWMDQMKWILANIFGFNRTVLINNNVYHLFIAIDTELSYADGEATPKRKDRAWEITSQFWSLLTKHSLRERSVKFYADALCITPDYLYKACRRAYGESPKALIDKQLTVEIKTYLTNTQLSVADIADSLRFEDASYLCRFFRRMTGYSPIEFRNGIEKKQG
ncbi:MAG: helix-turn-helix transcriptional regulator [Alistipes sp.]|nr:helix-turn-helix transcriptional regulator [Alistipes sp.]